MSQISLPNLEVYFNASIKPYNTFRIGGKAKYLFIVYDIDCLVKICRHCIIHKIKYKVIGLGANLLFDDKGYDGAIIVNRSEHISKHNNYLTVSSGTSIANLINYATAHNLSGLESFAGIPATLGGAITNNMGAHGVDIGNMITRVKCLDRHNPDKIVILKNKDCDFHYRHSVFKTNRYIILSATLRLVNNDKSTIMNRIKTYLDKKLSTQPVGNASAGSVFLRSSVIPAKVIDELGLKGHNIGGAKVSEKHAGFIINTGRATAHDVLALINYINSLVYDNYLLTLTTEIEYVEY